jgi:hypothetical protein
MYIGTIPSNMAVHNHTENVVPTPLTNNNLVLLCSEIERQMVIHFQFFFAAYLCNTCLMLCLV